LIVKFNYLYRRPSPKPSPIKSFISMATINFYLKDTTSKTPTPVNLIFNYGKPKPLKYAVGISVHPDDWTTQKQRVRDKRGMTDSMEKNRLLALIYNSIEKIYSDFQSKGIAITNEMLKDRLDIVLKRKEEKREMNFMEFMDLCVKEKKENNVSDRKLVSMVRGCILRYCAEKKVILDFKDIDMPFKEKFNAFIDSEKKKDGTARYAQNGKVGLFSGLRSILNYAQDYGLNPYNYFRNKHFGVKPEYVKKFSHTQDELMKILEVNLAGSPKMWGDIRDSFIIGSCTAMRISDYSTLGAENIDNGLIYKTTQKTGANVVLPVHWMIEEILKRRNGKFPPQHTCQNFNRVIKLIFKLAGINDTIMVSQTRGGVLVNKVVKKSEIMQSHTARRYGIREMLAAGIPKAKIMPMSGHTSEAAFDRYADVDVENNAKAFKDHPFFKKP